MLCGVDGVQRDIALDPLRLCGVVAGCAGCGVFPAGDRGMAEVAVRISHGGHRGNNETTDYTDFHSFRKKEVVITL